MQAWLGEKGVHLLGGDVDEAPRGFPACRTCSTYHSGSVKIEHILRPFAVLMAGSDVFDPFKD
jgi:tRNA-splicing ligase RtcB